MTQVHNYVGPLATRLSSGRPREITRKTLNSNLLPILGIDPGGTTGWSLLVLNRNMQDANGVTRDTFSFNFNDILEQKVSWDHGEINCRDYENEGVHQICRLMGNWLNAVVVVEDFILYPGRNEKSRDLLSPVRLTAKLDAYLWAHGRHMMLQTASQAKTSITDERLRLWHCYQRTGGLEHARDADRHVLLFLRRCMGTSGLVLRQNAWPGLNLEAEQELPDTDCGLGGF